MLTQLSIRNFAIIESIDLEFQQGVTVFTGETGAGKSILMDALALVLGARASTEYIRTGTNGFVVTAVFDVGTSDEVNTFLQDQNILPASDDDNLLVISRRLDTSGKGRILVNGMVVPLRTLARLGDMLVDIHRQNANLHLLSTSRQLAVLDASTPALTQALQEYTHAYQDWQSAQGEYRRWCEKMQRTQEKKETLEAQIAEIDAAALTSPEEEDTLETRLSRAIHAEKIVTHVETVLGLLSERGHAQETLAHSVSEAERAATYDDSLTHAAKTLETALISVEETIRDLQDYMYDMQFSPDELNRLQSRSQEIRNLKRKYGATVADVLLYARQTQEELATIENLEDIRRDKENALTRAHERAESLRTSLNDLRRKEAPKLCRKLTDILQELDLEHARLQFQFTDGTELTAAGIAAAELYFAPNPGEDAHALKDIASGGELARLALAVRAVDSPTSEQATWVLDEVDVGISGNAAIRVGKLINKIGRHTQVLCITHLAQTAAIADRHIHLSKHITHGRTETEATVLDAQGHVREIARMLEGDDYSSTAQETAMRLIRQMK